MAEMPKLPDPRDVAAWLMTTARVHNNPVVEFICDDTASARIWQTVLQETRTPYPITVRIHAPRDIRASLVGVEIPLMIPDYDVITVKVKRG